MEIQPRASLFASGVTPAPRRTPQTGPALNVKVSARRETAKRKICVIPEGSERRQAKSKSAETLWGLAEYSAIRLHRAVLAHKQKPQTTCAGHSTYPNEGHTLAAVPVKVTEMMFPELSNWITVRPLPSAKPWRLAGASDGKPMKSVGPSVTSVLLEKLIFAGPLMFRLMLVPVVTFVSVPKTGP